MNELDCKDIKALLSGIVDGELDVPTRYLAERHLAGCKECSKAVNEAERLNELLVMQAQALSASGLPAGFEESVLGQTIYGPPYQFTGRSWTSWLGWVAAAACLLLALSMWFVNPRSIPAPVAINHGNASRGNVSAPSVYAVNGKSFVYEGGLDPELLKRNHTGDSSAASRAQQIADETYHTIDAQLASTLPSGLPAAPVQPEVKITHDDADAIYAAANLLDMLKSADLNDFSDVEKIRQIAVYDDLIEKLTDSRSRVSPTDRPALMAAESVLLRVVNGPVSLDDLRMLHDTVAELNLPSRMEEISSRWQATSVL